MNSFAHYSFGAVYTKATHRPMRYDSG
jgi:hypothetical protein